MKEKAICHPFDCHDHGGDGGLLKSSSDADPKKMLIPALQSIVDECAATVERIRKVMELHMEKACQK